MTVLVLLLMTYCDGNGKPIGIDELGNYCGNDSIIVLLTIDILFEISDEIGDIQAPPLLMLIQWYW